MIYGGNFLKGGEQDSFTSGRVVDGKENGVGIVRTNFQTRAVDLIPGWII